MTKVVFGPSTLVPIGSIGVVIAMAFWVGGLAHEVTANGNDIKRVEASGREEDSARRSFEAEILQQMASQSATMAEMQSQAAATEAKIDLLIQWEKADRLPRKQKF